VFEVTWENDSYPENTPLLARCLCTIKAKDAQSAPNFQQTHLVMVLDISGSMNIAAKYPFLRQAMELMMSNLEDGIFLSVVLFSTESHLLCNALPAAEIRKNAANIVSWMDTCPIRFQETCLSKGLKIAMQVAQEFRQKEPFTIPRIYILTDGQLTDPEACFQLTPELESSKMEFHSFGFGNDFAFDSMRRLFGKSLGGTIKHIAQTNDIMERFQRVVQVSSQIIASQAKITLQFSDKIMPGDFFSHRPKPYLWPASQFNPMQGPVFEVGYLEAQREYIWALEAHLPPKIATSYEIANFQFSFTQGQSAKQVSWPILVPISGQQLGTQQSNITEVFDSLEELRNSSQDALIRAYEARISIFHREKRDPQHIQALQALLAKLKEGNAKQEIDESLVTEAELDPISTELAIVEEIPPPVADHKDEDTGC